MSDETPRTDSAGREQPARKPRPADVIRRDYPAFAYVLEDREHSQGPDPAALLRALRDLKILDAAATREPGEAAHRCPWGEAYGAAGVLGTAHMRPARTAADLQRWTDRVLAWLAWGDEHLAHVEPGEAAVYVSMFDICDAWADQWHAAVMREALAPDLSRLTDAQRARVREAAERTDFETDPFEPLTDSAGTLP